MSSLPPRCARCESGDWPYAPNGGVERCNCSRGKALASMDANRGRSRAADTPGVTAEQAMVAVEKLSIRMSMVPSGQAAHLEIADMLMDFVCDSEGLEWLVKQAPKTFKGVWPNMHEMRALYCAKYQPRDGEVVESGMFLEGFTSLAPQVLQIEAPPKRGGLVSQSSDLVAMVGELADRKSVRRELKLAPPEYLIPAEQR